MVIVNNQQPNYKIIAKLVQIINHNSPDMRTEIITELLWQSVIDNKTTVTEILDMASAISVKNRNVEID